MGLAVRTLVTRGLIPTPAPVYAPVPADRNRKGLPVSQAQARFLGTVVRGVNVQRSGFSSTQARDILRGTRVKSLPEHWSADRRRVPRSAWQPPGPIDSGRVVIGGRTVPRGVFAGIDEWLSQ